MSAPSSSVIRHSHLHRWRRCCRRFSSLALAMCTLDPGVWQEALAFHAPPPPPSHLGRVKFPVVVLVGSVSVVGEGRGVGEGRWGLLTACKTCLVKAAPQPSLRWSQTQQRDGQKTFSSATRQKESAFLHLWKLKTNVS